MPLSRSLDIANSALSVASERSAIAARNISHAGDAGATRKMARLSSDPGNAPRITGIARSVPDALLSRLFAAQSDAAKGSVLTAALDELQVVGDPQSNGAIGAKLSELQSALQTYAARPSDATAAANALGRAKDVVTTLHDGADAIERVRAQADRDIGASVDDLNEQLKQFAKLNTTVTQGSRSGRDVTDELDARDQVLSKIAEQIGLTVIGRADQGAALYTSGGIPLYDGQVRSVGLTGDPLIPGQPGRVLSIDGVAASGDGALLDISAGRLAGLIELRDNLTVTYGRQFDEIARGLVTAFAETDQGQPATLPDAAGLFRMAGSTGVPAGAAWQIGAARAVCPSAPVAARAARRQAPLSLSSCWRAQVPCCWCGAGPSRCSVSC